MDVSFYVLCCQESGSWGRVSSIIHCLSCAHRPDNTDGLHLSSLGFVVLFGVYKELAAQWKDTFIMLHSPGGQCHKQCPVTLDHWYHSVYRWNGRRSYVVERICQTTWDPSYLTLSDLSWFRRLRSYFTCIDFICHLFISILLYYSFPFFFLPPPPVLYLFFIFISIACVPFLRHHLLTSFI